MDATHSPEFQRQTVLKVSWRLLPLIIISYMMAYIDRVNISFAALTMNKDLGISAYVYGWGAGIFFLGYALFEVPSNMILDKVGARRWIARIMFTWGLISGAMAFVGGPTSFFVLRFLLGVAEAGFFPGIIYYLMLWFPGRYRARVISALFVAIPVSNAAASVISGAILEMDGMLGLHGWQWVFILEAMPAVLLAFVVWHYLTDRPREAKWLTAIERDWLEAQLAAERRAVENRGHMSWFRALIDKRVIVLALIYFMSVTSGYGIVFFLPQIVKALGESNFMTGILAAIPHAIGVIGLLLWGFSSDRRNERRRHFIAAACVSAIGFAAAAWLRESFWGIAAMSVATIGLYASRPAFWPMPSMFLSGAAAAAGIALINSIGNLGGYVGPMIVGWIKDSTKSFEMALYFLAACALSSAAIAYFAKGILETRATEPTAK